MRVDGVATGFRSGPFNPVYHAAGEGSAFSVENVAASPAGHPAELAPAYVLLACNDGSYNRREVMP